MVEEKVEYTASQRMKAEIAGFIMSDGSKVLVTDKAEKPRVTTPDEAFAVFYKISELQSKRKECFVALALDAYRTVIDKQVISVGSLASTLVHPREVFRFAIEAGAMALVVSHNHPSGNPEPSAEDLALTRRLRQSGEIIGIELLDHIIMAENGFTSLKERGHL